jgi:hypothetical protein
MLGKKEGIDPKLIKKAYALSEKIKKSKKIKPNNHESKR